MTREKARKAAEVMLAYADGKEIEFCNNHGGVWEKVVIPGFDWEMVDYRIQQEPTYRPFKDKEECWAEMQKHQPFGWLIDKNTKDYQNLLFLNGDGDTYENFFQHSVFADGTPFGIKEE